MRKFLSLLLIFVFAFNLSANALGRVIVWQNRNNTGEQVVVTVPTTTIIPDKHKILAVSIIDISDGHSECFVSFEDIVPDGSGGTVAEIIGEAETNVGGGNDWFDYPLSVITQIKVHQGAHTEALVYITR